MYAVLYEITQDAKIRWRRILPPEVMEKIDSGEGAPSARGNGAPSGSNRRARPKQRAQFLGLYQGLADLDTLHYLFKNVVIWIDYDQLPTDQPVGEPE